MNANTIDDWRNLFTADPQRWARVVDQSIETCLNKTQSSVVSHLVPYFDKLSKGKLAGVPYAIKDLFDTTGICSRNSSKLPVFKVKALDDCDVVKKMRDLGALCVAKTQMNEFAYGLSGENPHFGNCPHPVLENCLSGGSSSGSAHIVAARYLPLSFGTDTGGSIRLPAAWCGIYAIRWSPGYFLKGAFPLAPSFDTMGWFTNSLSDMAVVIESWFKNNNQNCEKCIKGASFLPKGLLNYEVYENLSSTFDQLDLDQITNPEEFEKYLPNYQFAFDILQSTEAYSIHKKWLVKYRKLYDPVVWERILRAEKWTRKNISTALLYKDQISKWFDSFFRNYDFLVMPICPCPSVPISITDSNLREKTLQLTSPASLSGLPALTVPIWLDDKRSVGIQLIFKNVEPSVPLSLLYLCKSI